MSIKQLLSNLAVWWKRWTLDTSEREFLRSKNELADQFNILVSSNPDLATLRGSFRRVLIQMPNDYSYLTLFGYGKSVLASNDSQITGLWHQNVMSSPRYEKLQGIRRIIRRCINGLDRLKWSKLYRSIGVGHFVSLEVGMQTSVRNWFKANKIWKSLETKEQLLSLKLNGTMCGDLIYDTYLRFRVEPTVILKDPYLRTIIAQCLNAQSAFHRHYRKFQWDCLLSSYSSYIQHGIPVREALKLGIEVYTAGNLVQHFKKLSIDDVLHTASHWKYGDVCKNLNNLSECLKQAKEALERRFAGKIDQATSYMKTSAYQVGDEVLPDGVEGVLFLHDFFDSPHCYRNMLFPDFWEWILFSLDIIEQHRLPIAVKPHPNQLPESKAVVEHLKKQYPRVVWLNPTLSNLTIFKSNIACGISVYGTVLHELAYFEIPAIAGGDHPHIDFNIAFTPTSREEYKQLLLNFKKLRVEATVKNEVLAFYYMHSIHSKESISMPVDLDFRRVMRANSGALDEFRLQLKSATLLN